MVGGGFREAEGSRAAHCSAMLPLLCAMFGSAPSRSRALVAPSWLVCVAHMSAV